MHIDTSRGWSPINPRNMRLSPAGLAFPRSRRAEAGDLKQEALRQALWRREFGLEEIDERLIELLVKCDTVEAGIVLADIRRDLGERLAARREKGEMPRQRHQMVIRRGWPRRLYDGGGP